MIVKQRYTLPQAERDIFTPNLDAFTQSFIDLEKRRIEVIKSALSAIGFVFDSDFAFQSFVKGKLSMTVYNNEPAKQRVITYCLGGKPIVIERCTFERCTWSANDIYFKTDFEIC